MIQVFKLQRTYYTANRLKLLFNGCLIVLRVLWPRFQSIEKKAEKMTFPALINSKSIFLHPINKT